MKKNKLYDMRAAFYHIVTSVINSFKKSIKIMYILKYIANVNCFFFFTLKKS